MAFIVKLRNRLCKVMQAVRLEWMRSVWGMNIGNGTRIATTSRLDLINPKGIYIGTDTEIGSNAVILAHDFLTSRHTDWQPLSYRHKRHRTAWGQYRERLYYCPGQRGNAPCSARIVGFRQSGAGNRKRFETRSLGHAKLEWKTIVNIATKL